MSTLQILIVILGGITATVLLALGWAFFAIAKQMDEQANLPCCYRPNIVEMEWQGQSGPYCMNCKLWTRPTAATRSSPGTMERVGWEVLRKEDWMRPGGP